MPKMPGDALRAITYILLSVIGASASVEKKKGKGAVAFTTYTNKRFDIVFSFS